MTNLSEGRLTFIFDAGCGASAYDKRSFFRNQYQSVCGSSKGVDFLCIDNGVLWLIEIKDYRRRNTPKPSNLAPDVARKMRDTLAGLMAAQCHANDAAERDFARRAARAGRLRVVIHVEQPEKISRLFPRAVDPADLKIQLEKLLKAIDPHPAIVDQHNLQPAMNWTVAG
jgi:hypothetical protein